MTYPKDSMDIFNTIAILKHMHVFQSFCIAMSLVLFRHNKTPKVFCLTFGVHVNLCIFFFKNITLRYILLPSHLLA